MAHVEFKWVVVERPMHAPKGQFVLRRSSGRYNTVRAAIKAGEIFMQDVNNLDFDICDSSGIDLDIERYLVSTWGMNSLKKCQDPDQHTKLVFNYVIVKIRKDTSRKVVKRDSTEFSTKADAMKATLEYLELVRNAPNTPIEKLFDVEIEENILHRICTCSENPA